MPRLVVFFCNFRVIVGMGAGTIVQTGERTLIFIRPFWISIRLLLLLDSNRLVIEIQ